MSETKKGKLTLNVDTLRHLTGQQSRAVVGGTHDTHHTYCGTCYQYHTQCDCVVSESWTWCPTGCVTHCGESTCECP